MTLASILLIVGAALLGAPLFLVIAAIALVGFLSLGGGGAVYASLIEPVRTVVSQDIFLAIPLFTFAGFVMAAANTPTRLVNLSKAFLGWLPGGIAIVALVACAFFTAFTGASGVTIIALGGLLFPILLKERYPENFSLGLMTTGGSRGLIFPPSLPLILYATIAAVTFAPLIEEQRSAGPPDGWLNRTVTEAPATTGVGAAATPTAGDDAELEALLGDDDEGAAAPTPAAAKKSDADAELEALLGDDEEGAGTAAAPAAAAAATGPTDEADAELEALLGDDEEGAGTGAAAVATAAAPTAPKGALLAPFARVSEIAALVGKARGGDFLARDELWNLHIEFERNKRPTPEKLFVAGAIPGALMVIAIAIYAVFIGWRRRVPRTKFEGMAILRSLKAAFWELPIPLIILVGIYGGFFTAQEAAGVTAFYVLVVETLLYRDISWRRLPKVMLDSMILVGGVMLILIAALALKDYMVLAEVPQTLRDLMTAHISDPLTFLLLLNVFLLVVGCLMDIFSAILVVVPLIVPLAVAYGIHPVHLGVIFLTNLEIGYSTPPVGINLFIASLRFRRPIVQLYVACMPFLGILLAGLILITYWPDLSLWLLRVTGME